MILVAALCGLRQGECFGRVEDVDFLRRELHVRQQIRIEVSRPVAPSEDVKTRTVPMPDLLGRALAQHLEKWEPLAGE